MIRNLQGSTRSRWVIFGVLALQYLLVYFHRVCPAVVAPELTKTFQISGTSLGVLASGYFYSYAIMQIPVGLLSDRWGTRKTITLFSAAAAVGALLLALAPTFGFAIFARILVGLGVSATFVGSLRTLAVWFKGHEYARVTGLFMAMGGIGWFSAATPLAVLTEGFGWRVAFMATGVLSVGLALLTWTVVADSPGENHHGPPKGIPGEGDVQTESLLKALRGIFAERHFWAITIWLFFAQGTLFSLFGLWAGPYLMDTYSLGKSAAGNILSMVALGMVFGGPFLGHLSDRIMESRKRVVLAASTVNVICLAILLFDPAGLPFYALYGIFFLMGVTLSAVVVVVFTSVKELFPVRISGTALGTANLFGFFGGILFQPLIGYVLDATGKVGGIYPVRAYQRAFVVYLAINLIALISACFTKETFRSGLHRS
jgi:sugar phosphate permease